MPGTEDDATGWLEVAAGVLVRRHAGLDLNATVVLGDDSCLVVDTRATLAQGRRLADAVRRLTAAPWTVACTHDHFDHWYGNAAFAGPGVRVLGHEAGRFDDAGRADAVAYLRGDGDPVAAAQAASTPLVPPTDRVAARTRLELGGRHVLLVYHGRGHTDHDLLVEVPDAGVLVAGDLVEVCADPAMDDAYPLEWPVTLARALAGAAGRPPRTVVPGHGDVVGAEVADDQRADLQRLADRATELAAELATGLATGRAAGLATGPVAGAATVPDDVLDRAAAGLPFDPATCRTAFRRVLAGTPGADPGHG
ncbi:MBL fold metallo-hydrolase [Quadrisphaera sp. GCM10027208]|uniref:MBL fold metallo-hydrolase n=1 Tax=Quadrisphaera sp. GCM10027208 TaxID=3273423 RepID=UPI0036167ED4